VERLRVIKWSYLLLLAVMAVVMLGDGIAQGQESPAALEAGAEVVSLEIAEEAVSAEGEIKIPWIWWIAPIGSIVALVFAFKFFKEVKGANQGDAKMKEIAKHVSDGAMAYLKQQYKVVFLFFVVVSVILYFMGQAGLQHPLVFIAFLTGGFFSGLCGFLGMKTACRWHLRLVRSWDWWW
jgi:FtsH-binding integral membrane protein